MNTPPKILERVGISREVMEEMNVKSAMDGHVALHGERGIETGLGKEAADHGNEGTLDFTNRSLEARLEHRLGEDVVPQPVEVRVVADGRDHALDELIGR